LTDQSDLHFGVRSLTSTWRLTRALAKKRFLIVSPW
jgi:hypothetical protein